MNRNIPSIRDFWTMSHYAGKRLWCLAFHWHMVKLGEVTTGDTIEEAVGRLLLHFQERHS